MRIHVCLVSRRAAANLLAALDPVLRPEQVVLVATDKMQGHAANLQVVLQAQAIRVEQLQLHDAGDFQHAKARLLALAAALASHDVAINITGGPRLVAFAALAVAGASGWRAFQVDADRGELTWLNQDDASPRTRLQPLRLKQHLGSCGLEFVSSARCPAPGLQQWTLIQTLVTQLASLEQAVTQLIGLVQDAEDRNSLYVQMSDHQLDSRSLNVLLDHFWRAGAFNLLGDEIRFSDEAARDFVKGGWLEFHAMDAVNRLTGPLDIRDKALGLQLVDVHQATGHAVDMAFLAHNRLFILAFRAERFGWTRPAREDPQPPRVFDALFGLSAQCRRLTAAGAKGMLLSYRQPTRTERQLASSLGIEVVAGTSLMDLDRKISQWIHAAA